MFAMAKVSTDGIRDGLEATPYRDHARPEFALRKTPIRKIASTRLSDSEVRKKLQEKESSMSFTEQ